MQNILHRLKNSAVTLNYVDDKEYSIKPIRWLLRPIGVWPVRDSSIKEKILTKILLFICIFLLGSILISCALGIFLDANKDVETKVREMGPLSTWILASMKYSSLLLHVDDIAYCIQHIETDWRIVTNIADREVMLKNAKIGRFISMFSAVFMHSGVFSYNLFRGLTTQESFVEGNNTSKHVLPFAFYNKILDTTTSPAYEIVFVTQCLSTFVVNSVVVSACSLSAVLVMHACGQLNIMMSWLDKLVDERNEKGDVQRRFAVIVEHHLRILR